VIEAAELLRRLVACDTSNPPGREAAAAAIVEDVLRDAGVACERVAKDPERPNLIARLRGRGDGPSLCFLGHLDVVQARWQDWSTDPFAGAIVDGVLVGRGTVDMKSQVAAAVTALATLARERFEPNGDVMLVLCADEEVGDANVGAPFLVKARPDLAPTYVIGEGGGERYVRSDGPVYTFDHGVKMSAKATLTVRGRAADASLPGNGENALVELARLLTRLPQPQRPEDPWEWLQQALAQNVWTPTAAEANGPQNVVPEQATATIYCAALPGATKDGLDTELRELLGPGGYDLEVSEPTGGRTSPVESPLRDAIESFVAENDADARVEPVLGYGFSDCDLFRQHYGSIAYGFIPFRHAPPLENLTRKHGVDERIRLADLEFQVAAALSIAKYIGALR
jgi:acetylornithine deacetylase/succinyl-diaminopimelate desuccinylase-like protein